MTNWGIKLKFAQLLYVDIYEMQQCTPEQLMAKNYIKLIFYEPMTLKAWEQSLPKFPMNVITLLLSLSFFFLCPFVNLWIWGAGDNRMDDKKLNWASTGKKRGGFHWIVWFKIVFIVILFFLMTILWGY